MASTLKDLLLEKIETNDSVNTLQLSRECNESHQAIVGAMKSLQTLENVSRVVSLVASFDQLRNFPSQDA